MILKRRLIAVAAMLSALVLHSGASASNGIDTYETSVSYPDFYVACLGEMVRGEISLVGLYHEFDTPSGKYHLVDHWRYSVELTGLTTGNKWFGRGFSPWVLNIGPGQAFQAQDNWRVRPVSGDGPNIRVHLRIKMTVNANGELVVSNDDFASAPQEDWYQCFGK